MSQSPYQADDPGQPTQSAPRRRGQTALRWLAAVVIGALVVLTVVAIVNQNRGNSGVGANNAAAAAGSTKSTPPPTLAPGTACPLVTDELSHLSYRCIDDYLRGDYPDSTLGLSTTLDYAVEPNWEIVQGSGLIPTTSTPGFGQLQAQVRARTDRAIKSAYGAHPSYRTLREGPLSLSGSAGYEKVMQVRIDADYRAQNHIRADLERLWVLGLPTSRGVAIFMLTIPDNRKDLWPKADATVATVHVI